MSYVKGTVSPRHILSNSSGKEATPMTRTPAPKPHPATESGGKSASRAKAVRAKPPIERQRPARENGSVDFPGAGSEMGALMRSIDWAATPIGAVETWSPALRMMVGFMLANRFPLLLWWGPQYVSIYNDAYRPILGEKHPRAMGQPVKECWNEIWHILEPLIDTPFRGGPATWMEDLHLELNRHGFVEETHFTIAYSQVPDDTAPRGIGGVLATVHEITQKVVGERRTTILRDLGGRASEARTAEEACSIAADTLARHAQDVPFALIYLLDPEGEAAHLAGATGIDVSSAIAPSVIGLNDVPANGAPWPLGEAVRTHAIQVVEDIAARFPSIPPGPWRDPPHTAVVLPIPSNKARQVAGFLIAGISARLKLDDGYRGFLGLMVTQIANAIANARAYEEERKRAEALAEVDRAKTLFFSNVSHEFRTPLTLILGSTEDALNSGGLPAEERERLTVSRRNSLRLLRLVNTLLDFSRVEAGRLQASYEPVDLSTITRDLASNFRSACEKAGLDLVIDCPPLPEPIYVDPEMWEKIVLNLVSNAFKFTLEGEIAVRLRSHDGAAELTVRDTGIGIPDAELPRIFERFHRVENAGGRTVEGTGIGLALVKDLIGLHGGAVKVESKLGEGTIFVVSLPSGYGHLPPDRVGAARTQASTATSANAFVGEALRWLPSGGPGDGPGVELLHLRDAADTAGGNLLFNGRRARVLLADDNADMRDYVHRLLASAGADVEAVSDGRAALDASRRGPPDLILSDVMMPKLDGFGLLRELRADPNLRTVPVILLSARAGEEARVEGLQAGADDYLTKPFSARELIARIGSNLQLARVRRQAEEALQEEAHALEILNRVGAAVAAELDLEHAVQVVTDAATELTGAAFGSFFYNVRDEHGESYMLHTLSGAPREAFSKFPLPRNTAVFAPTFRGQGIVRSDDILQDPRYGKNDPYYGMPRGHLPVRSYLSAPVISRSGEVLGGLFFGHPQPGIFSERSERLLIGISAQAAIAIDNGRLYQAAQAEIAERKRAEQALRESEERLRQANAGLARRVTEFQTANAEVQDARRAALNLMEDAVQSRQLTEALNTQLQTSQEQLREGERRFREMVDALPAAIYTTDAQGRITHFNPASVTFTGRTPELGTDRWCVSWKLYYPDGTPMPHGECPMAIALKEGRIVNGTEAILERPDGTRRWFTPYPTPLRDATGRIVGGINMLVDITERKQAEQRRQLLMNELNHRVKNTLATVQSIAAQSLKGASDPELQKAFDARLVSLSRTHDLLSRETWESASLRELLLLELVPYGSEESKRFIIEGPEITVNPKAALALGLAFHELATNAAKYGALAKPTGQVRVEWDVLRSSEPSTLRLKWTETGGPPVKKSGRKGFGSIVIERGLSLDLDAEVHADFGPGGLVFTADIPLTAGAGGVD
jgi:PAS domain S-box-containing protein